MTQPTTEASQRTAARIAGFTLLLLILSGVLGSFVFQAHLIVSNDPAATAHNILAHQSRFRLGLASGTIMFNCDVVLALALYALLKPVNGTLALLGTFWRIANATVLATGVATNLIALDLLSGAHYLAPFTTAQQQTLSSIFMSIGDGCSTLGLIFFCFGAAVHSYLLLESGYIPKLLSAAYLFVAVQLLLCTFALMVYPHLADVFGLVYVLPDFVVELSVALWLAVKGANIPEPAS